MVLDSSIAVALGSSDRRQNNEGIDLSPCIAQVLMFLKGFLPQVGLVCKTAAHVAWEAWDVYSGVGQWRVLRNRGGCIHGVSVCATQEDIVEELYKWLALV